MKNSLYLEQIQANIVSKPTEITDPWAVDVSDIFPGPKESVSTIGGILGELWLLLEVLQTEQQVELKPEEVNLCHYYLLIFIACTNLC